MSFTPARSDVRVASSNGTAARTLLIKRTFMQVSPDRSAGVHAQMKRYHLLDAFRHGLGVGLQQFGERRSTYAIHYERPAPAELLHAPRCGNRQSKRLGYCRVHGLPKGSPVSLCGSVNFRGLGADL